jgi:hypothetical protein
VGRPQRLGPAEGLRRVHRGSGRDRQAPHWGSSPGLKLRHVFGTATRRHPLTAEHNRTHSEQRPTSFMQVGRCFSRSWAVGRGGVEPPTFRFSGVTSALFAVSVPRSDGGRRVSTCVGGGCRCCHRCCQPGRCSEGPRLRRPVRPIQRVASFARRDTGCSRATAPLLSTAE